MSERTGLAIELARWRYSNRRLDRQPADDVPQPNGVHPLLTKSIADRTHIDTRPPARHRRGPSQGNCRPSHHFHQKKGDMQCSTFLTTTGTREDRVV